VNERLGAYRIVGMIGEGAMGVVYEGRHDILGRRVAIKTLRPELARNPQVAPRFLREARAATRVTHENIVTIYDQGTAPDGGAYIVMELLEGETLADRLRRGPLGVPELAHVFGQILRALAEAHAAGVVHRDLKPPNVYLTRRGDDALFVKLLDFGVARLSAELTAQKLTTPGMLIGTPAYMSPEQIFGKPVDLRSDLFSVGVMLYEAAVGVVPFGGANMGELAANITRSEPPPPRLRAPELPQGLEAVILRALAKDPAARFPSAAAMFDALRAATRRLTGARDVEPRPRATPPPARWRRWAIAVGAAAALAGAGAAVARLRRAPPPAAPAAAPAAPRFDGAAALRAAIASPDAAEAADAVAALAAVGGAATAPLLYPALDGPPELRRQAARALEALALPEAAPRIRRTLDASGPRLRVELAAILAALGDREVLPILRRGADEPGSRLAAALGLVAAGERAAAQPMLAEIAAAAPRGRGEWREATAALAGLGAAGAADALAEELALADGERAVAAAALLAARGDERGTGFLRRVVEDAGFARRGEAALALARVGDRAAQVFVAPGLASADPEERRLAAAVAGRLSAERAALETLAAGDPDRRVRLTAAAALVTP
jgi:serine/threonine-protein kinase